MYFGAVSVFKNRSADFTSFDGVKESANLYFSWMVYAVKNVVQITSNVLKMDWTPYENNSSLNKTKR